MKIYLLLFMIFAHIIDDFVLQGVLANMKQKKFWKEKAPDELYKHDYVASLFIHGLSWAITTHLPLIFLYGASIASFVFFSILIHAVLHAVIDDLKANQHKINLIQDQVLHLIQLIITSSVVYAIFGG